MGERRTVSSYNQGDRFWYAPTLLLLPAALLTTFSGILGLYVDGSGEVAQPCRAVAAVLLLLSGTAQLFMVRRIHHSAGTERAGYWRRTWQNLRALVAWFSAGVLGCYGLALAIGPQPGITWLLVATVNAWYTVMMWYVVAPGRLGGRLQAFAQRRLARTAMRSVWLFMAGLFFVEVGLQLCSWAGADRLTTSFVVRKALPPPGSEVLGHTINSQGFPGNDFQTARKPDVARIAILGDELALSGCTQSNFVRMIDERMPGVEIYNFGVAEAGPREYAAVFVDQVATYRPDLVLCFVSVGDDVACQNANRCFFDWRSLQLGRLAEGVCGGRSAICTSTACSRRCLHSQTEFLRHRGRQLSVCQTPLTEDMNGRWNALQSHMKRLAETCHSYDVPLGIVLIPSDFQINEVLLSTLQRRMGYVADAIDVELPQRRLRLMAQAHRLPTLDLLPTMREAGASAYCQNQNLLSRQGNALVADSLELWLERQYGSQLAGLERRPTALTARVAAGTLRR